MHKNAEDKPAISSGGKPKEEVVWKTNANGTVEAVTRARSVAEPSVMSSKEEAMSKTRLKWDYSKEEDSDVIMHATFTIKNEGTADIKDVEITCTHFGNSGTTIDSNKRTIYERVKPNGAKTVRNFRMGFIHSQVASSKCKITNLVVG